MLAEAAWGGMMVVPAWNMDVTIGVARDGLHEPWTTRLVQELLRPGERYLNAGANFGYFVCLAGRLVGPAGRVVGVEPNPHIVPFLMKSLYWNGSIGNTEVVVRALSDTPDEPLTFHFDPQYLGGGAPRDVSAPLASAERDFATPEEARWSAATLPQMLDAEGRWIKGIGLMTSFETRTATIDGILARFGLDGLDLLHLDIEGSEAAALLGARRTIATSRRLKIITEWSAGHYVNAAPRLRDAFNAAWEMLTGHGYRVRHLRPQLAGDGGLFVSPPLTRAAMTETAPHGDYVWIKAEEDPFA